MVNKITKDTLFSEVLEKYPETIEILLDSGMHCIGCPASIMETIEQGAEMHGIDSEELIKKLNKKISKKK